MIKEIRSETSEKGSLHIELEKLKNKLEKEPIPYVPDAGMTASSASSIVSRPRRQYKGTMGGAQQKVGKVVNETKEGDVVVTGTLVNDEIWNIPGGIIYNDTTFKRQLDLSLPFVDCESSPWGGDDKNTEKLERFLETWKVQITKVGNFELTFIPTSLEKTLPDPMKEMYQLLGFVLNKYEKEDLKRAIK